MKADGRSHLELHLVGGTSADGEIPLDELARIVSETQKLVVRIARSLTDRSGPGRTRAVTTALTQLTLVGIREGTTVLDIAGPRLQTELELEGDVPPNVGAQALTLVLDGAAAMAEGQPLPPVVYDNVVAEGFAEWLIALSPYPRVELMGTTQGTRRTTTLEPAAVRATLARRIQAPVLASETSETYVAEGDLYAVNLHTGRYQLEDDSGHRFACHVDEPDAEQAATLLGHRVRATGAATRDPSGRIQALHVIRLEPAPPGPLDQHIFWASTNRDELLRDGQPLASVEDLVIVGLTPEEEEDFLAALEE